MTGASSWAPSCSSRPSRRGSPQRTAHRRSGSNRGLGSRVRRLLVALGRRDGVVDEDGRDGGRGGERFGVEDAAASRRAVQKQRQLLAELLGVGGAGLPGRFGEPPRKCHLVVAGEDACCMAPVSYTHL